MFQLSVIVSTTRYFLAISILLAEEENQLRCTVVDLAGVNNV